MPRSAIQRSAARESPTSTRAISGSPRPSVTRAMSAAKSAVLYGGTSVAANRSSGSTRSRRSSRPSWTVRIAPAVKAELPPDHSRGAFSKTSTEQPVSRAA